MYPGKGKYLYKKTSTIYDGDWLNDERHGYGVLTRLVSGGELMTEYAGGWKEGRKHVSARSRIFMLVVKRTGAEFNNHAGIRCQFLRPQ